MVDHCELRIDTFSTKDSVRERDSEKFNIRTLSEYYWSFRTDTLFLCNITWRTAPKDSIRKFIAWYFDMDSNSKAAKSSSLQENERNSMLDPLLSERLDSVSQTSGKRSRSRISSSSRHSSSSSVARRKVLAEAVAAKQEVEFDRLLAEKEREKMEMEAEEERKRQSHLAKCTTKPFLLRTRKPQ